MKEQLSLRERKKLATRVRLMETALTMFEERGFDEVSVAEVAEAAELSKATVFNYFPTKEDLVLAGAKQHIDEPAQIVRDRPVGQTPHGALRRYFLAHLKAHSPVSGLSDHPIVMRVLRIVRTSPGLALRAMGYRGQAAEALAEALIEEGGSELTARLVATQLMHTQHILSQMNTMRIYDGATPEEALPEAVETAEQAFRLLANGIGEFMPRAAPPDAAFHDDPQASYRPEAGDTPETLERVVLDSIEDELYDRLLDPDCK